MADDNLDDEEEEPIETPPRSEEELAEEWAKKGSQFGPAPTVEQIKKIRELWALEGLKKIEIARKVRVGMNIVNEATRGIPRGRPPASQIVKIEDIPPRVVPEVRISGISEENLARLERLALGAGYNSVDEFLTQELIPFYGIKLQYDFGLDRRTTVKEFADFVRTVSRKAVRLDYFLSQARAELEEGEVEQK